jgi:hypothetical protein
MATRAHSTRTPLLRLSGSTQPLLGLGLGRQPGPVTLAIRAMRAADEDANLAPVFPDFGEKPLRGVQEVFVGRRA